MFVCIALDNICNLKMPLFWLNKSQAYFNNQIHSFDMFDLVPDLSLIGA
jgi:hypothetical protein